MIPKRNQIPEHLISIVLKINQKQTNIFLQKLSQNRTLTANQLSQPEQ